jgi:hypothetical protein
MTIMTDTVTGAIIEGTGTVAWILTAMGASNDGNATAWIGTGTGASNDGSGTVTMIATTGAMVATAIPNIGTVSIGKLFSTAECINAGRGIAPAFSFLDRNFFAVR